MKTVITGANGQVAFELQRLAGVREVVALTKEQLDISQSVEIINIIKPKLVINVAAYTQVDHAEKNPEAAYAANCEGAKNLAIACEKINCPLIHLSTDYVFSGEKAAPYLETDTASPLNVYGASKWEGEQLIRQYCENHMIVRVSAVFGVHGNNFVKTMLRLAREKPSLRIISDQVICPTPAHEIAKMLWSLSKENAWGTYHYCGSESTNWYEFAKKILPDTIIEPIATLEYATAALRPKYSVLDCQKMQKTFNIPQPDWQKGLADVIHELSTT